MEKEEIIKHAKRIYEASTTNSTGSLVQAREFLKTYAGNDNQFLKLLLEVDPSKNSIDSVKYRTKSVLTSFIEYVENDLLRAISLEREIQLETVSDYLDQANTLLNDTKVHPAAAAVIIGASLEEFLRTWLEEENVDLFEIKNSIDSYCKELQKLNLLSKQDIKDIISWGGIRNDAAHGHWENVADRQRIRIMLEAVNLFIRKHS